MANDYSIWVDGTPYGQSVTDSGDYDTWRDGEPLVLLTPSTSTDINVSLETVICVSYQTTGYTYEINTNTPGCVVTSYDTIINVELIITCISPIVNITKYNTTIPSEFSIEVSLGQVNLSALVPSVLFNTPVNVETTSVNAQSYAVVLTLLTFQPVGARTYSIPYEDRIFEIN